MMRRTSDGHRTPQSVPFIEDMSLPALADKLLKSEKPEDFVTALNFPDRKRAMAWARCIHKCSRHKMDEMKRLFWTMALSECAIGEQRAKLFAQAIMMVAVPEFFGGGSEKEKAKT